MFFNRILHWFKDPITIIGFMNLFTMMQLTLYRFYLAIFLEIELLVSFIIISFILSSINFFQIFMRVPIAGFSQVIGRKPVILFGNFFISFGILLLVFSIDPFIPFISSIIVGIGMSAHWPATFAYIRDVSPKNYGKANGKIFKIGDIGIIIGSLSAKILLDEFLIGLRNFYLILFFIGSLAVFLFYLVMPEVIDSNEKMIVSNYSEYFRTSIVTMFVSFANISKHPGMIKIYVFQYFISFTEFIFSALFGALIVFKGFSQGTVGEIVFWATLGLLWFKPYLGNISDRFGYRYPVLLSLISTGSIFCLLLIIDDFFILIIIYFIVTAFMFISYPAVNGATALTSSSQNRGIALGALGVYTSIGRATSTIILAPIGEWFNVEIVFLLAGLIILFVGILLWFWSKTSLNIESKQSQIS